MSDGAGRSNDLRDLLTPTSRAVTGLALALAALLGPNSVASGFQMIVMGGPEAGDPALIAIGFGVGTAVPAVLALLLAWPPAQSPATSWPAHVSRAAVLVALVALLGAVLMVIGGLLQF